MKPIITILGVASVLTACKDAPETRSEITSPITAEDAAWASGWTIYKWDASRLTTQPIHGMALVIIGADGTVIQEIGPIGMLDEPSTGKEDVAVAFRKEGKKVYLRMRYRGVSIDSETKDIFDQSDWGHSASFGLSGDTWVIATDSDVLPSQSADLLKLKRNKLCLRVITKK